MKDASLIRRIIVVAVPSCLAGLVAFWLAGGFVRHSCMALVLAYTVAGVSICALLVSHFCRRRRGIRPALNRIFMFWVIIFIMAAFAVFVTVTYGLQKAQYSVYVVEGVLLDEQNYMRQRLDQSQKLSEEGTQSHRSPLYDELSASLSLENMFIDYNLGEKGFLLALRDGVVQSGRYPHWRGLTVEQLGLDLAALPVDGGYAVTSVLDEDYYCVAEYYRGYLLMAAFSCDEVMELVNFSTNISAGFYALLFLLTTAIIALLVDKVVASDIHKTNAVLARITQGDLEQAVEVRTTTEFSALSDGINATVTALKGAVAEAASRIDSELAFARAIQAAALPELKPEYSANDAFSLAAFMEPAKEVGGDFYDYFLLDEDHLALVMADVSDKGIPAAMFMMIAKTYIRDHMEYSDSLDQALEAVNRRLCVGNEEGMFVTAWAGILELSSGRLSFVNAGHNYPLILRGGSFHWLTQNSGLVLAGSKKTRYHLFETMLDRDDALLLYTDGVTEARNEQGGFYSDERLHRLVNQHLTATPAELLRFIQEDITVFANGAGQTDDITMLAVRMTGKYEEYRIPATLEGMSAALDHLDAKIIELGCEKQVRLSLLTAADEILANIVFHSGAGSVQVGWAVDAHAVSLRFVDDGMAYDPRQKNDPILEGPLSQRQEGGLGLYLTRRLTDMMFYEYGNGKNITTLKKRW